MNILTGVVVGLTILCIISLMMYVSLNQEIDELKSELQSKIRESNLNYRLQKIHNDSNELYLNRLFDKIRYMEEYFGITYIEQKYESKYIKNKPKK